MNLSLEGMPALQRMIRETPKEARKHLVDYVVKPTTFAIMQRAKALAPRNTGALRAAIASNAETRQLTGKVGFERVTTGRGPQVYWRFLEFGTRKMAAQPFFRPATDLESGQVEGRLRRMGQQIEKDAAVLGNGRFL